MKFNLYTSNDIIHFDKKHLSDDNDGKNMNLDVENLVS